MSLALQLNQADLDKRPLRITRCDSEDNKSTGGIMTKGPVKKGSKTGKPFDKSKSFKGKPFNKSKSFKGKPFDKSKAKQKKDGKKEFSGARKPRTKKAATKSE